MINAPSEADRIIEAAAARKRRREVHHDGPAGVVRMRRLRSRRRRRQAAQALEWGNEAKPRHRLRSGRTGSAHSKKEKPKS